MTNKHLQLIAIGDVQVPFLCELDNPLMQVLGIQTYLSEAHMPLPTFAFNKDRDQFHATAIMRRLVTLKDSATFFIMGVANVDLFMPESSFVYGAADRGEQVAIMSLHRLIADGYAWKRSAFVEAVHQIGHLIGLPYCEDARCAMFLALTITDANRRRLKLCNSCSNDLGGL